MTSVSPTGLGNFIQPWFNSIDSLLYTAKKESLLNASSGTAIVGKGGVTVKDQYGSVVWQGNKAPSVVRVSSITIQKGSNVVTTPMAMTSGLDLKNFNYIPGYSRGELGVNVQSNHKDGNNTLQKSYFYRISECKVTFDADTVVVTLPNGKSIVYQQGDPGYGLIAPYAQKDFEDATA
jgi:hypothetical protein